MILPTAINGITTSSEATIINIIESGFISRESDTCCDLSNSAGVNFTIYSGETITKAYGLANSASLDDWTCRVQIRDIARTQLYYDQIITTKNQAGTEFLVNIPTSLTETFPQGYYVIAAQLDNTVSLESNEIVEKFEVIEQWVY